MRKRYKNGDPEWVVYNDQYCKLQAESRIFNSGANRPGMNMIIWDKTNINAQLLARTGDKDGKHKYGEETYTGEIPYTQNQLLQIEAQFAKYVRNRVNLGYEIPNWPKDLLNKRLLLEAKLDVVSGECERLQKTLNELKDVVEKVDDSKVLQYGLQGSGVMKNSILVLLDGQNLTLTTPDEVLIIDDKRSPYDQMRVSDYRKMSKQWTQDRLTRAEEKFKALQKECKEQGKNIPQQQAAISMKKVDKKSSLPPWPEGVLPYAPPEPEPEVEDSSSSMKRTKNSKKRK